MHKRYSRTTIALCLIALLCSLSYSLADTPEAKPSGSPKLVISPNKGKVIFSFKNNSLSSKYNASFTVYSFGAADELFICLSFDDIPTSIAFSGIKVPSAEKNMPDVYFDIAATIEQRSTCLIRIKKTDIPGIKIPNNTFDKDWDTKWQTSTIDGSPRIISEGGQEINFEYGFTVQLENVVRIIK